MTDEQTMVERVGCAIGFELDNWFSPPALERHKRAAPAAIEAMRESTQAMMDAAAEADSDYIKSSQAQWRAAIDAALAEP